MRQDCKYYESRTYPNGDTVRKCDLDLAPEAPWRCPENCPSYTRRMADVNWSYGSLVTPETPPEPESLGRDESIGALLDAAEDIVNAAAPEVFADLETERRNRRGPLKGIRRGLKKTRKKETGKKKLSGNGRPSDPGPGGNKTGQNKTGKKPRGRREIPKRQRGDSGGGLGERLRRRYRDGG